MEYIWLTFETYTMTFSFTTQLYFALLGFGLLGLAWDFQKDLDQCGLGIPLGIKLYLKIKWKMDVVSKAWKVQLPTFAIFLVAYYAGLPDILMGYINEEPLESLVIFLIVNTAGWILAAKFHAINLTNRI